MINTNISPISSFQRIVNQSSLSEEARTVIQNTVLQFYVHNQPQEEEADDNYRLL